MLSTSLPALIAMLDEFDVIALAVTSKGELVAANCHAQATLALSDASSQQPWWNAAFVFDPVKTSAAWRSGVASGGRFELVAEIERRGPHEAFDAAGNAAPVLWLGDEVGWLITFNVHHSLALLNALEGYCAATGKMFPRRLKAQRNKLQRLQERSDERRHQQEPPDANQP